MSTTTLRFHYTQLRNEEWFQFHTEVRDLIAGSTSAALGIDKLHPRYLAKYDEADTALEILRKSPITEKLAEADRVRDQYYRGFVNVIAGNVIHFNAAMGESAARIQAIIAHYGNLTRQTYDSETASLTNFIQEMRGRCAADITALGVDGWIDQLDNANKAFEALMQERYKEKDSQTTLRMATVRGEMDKIYNLILDQLDINAATAAQPDIIEPFITALNNRIARYRDTLAQRAGQMSASVATLAAKDAAATPKA